MADCPCPPIEPKPVLPPLPPPTIQLPINPPAPPLTVNPPVPQRSVMSCPPVNIRPLTCEDQITVCGPLEVVILGGAVEVTGTIDVNVINFPEPLEVIILGGTVTVTGHDLDIRNLTCAQDSVTVCQPVVSATFTSVAQTNSSVTLLAANVNRKGAIIYNNANSTAWIKFGATASQTSFSVRLVTETFYELTVGYVGVIDGIWAASGAGAMRVTEFI